VLIVFFKQFYLGCLAHASYLIGSKGKACVVDPQRDVAQYIEEAEKHGLKIEYIFETHVHADFVSGHKELAELTGAIILCSDKAEAGFDHRPVVDGSVIELGDLTVNVLATPGHTPDSICLLLQEKDSDAPMKLLTGDTLFIGDVGRPDLVGKSGYGPADMAALLYDSLHQKILSLPDQTEVYPAHGAGSMCGKNISSDKSSTIGAQKKFNYALQPMSKEEFVTMLTAELAEVPAYFSRAVAANRAGAASLSGLSQVSKLSPAQVKSQQENEPNLIILDTRSAKEFGIGHIPGAYNVGLEGQFASWCGTVLGADHAIILVLSEDSQVDEAVLRLARAGLENVCGYLAGGMEAWHAAGLETESIEQITVQELSDLLDNDPHLKVLDVRRAAEYESGHVPRAKNISLSELESRLEAVETGVKTAVICAAGYRSSMATSLLQRHGREQLLNVIGGTQAWQKANLPVKSETTNKSCST